MNTEYYETILDQKMIENEYGFQTIREYIWGLTSSLFGVGSEDSHSIMGEDMLYWDLYTVFIFHNLIDGQLDEDGFISSCDEDQGKELMFQILKYIFKIN